MRRLSIFALAVVMSFAGCRGREHTIVVGSKNFTEQLILGELVVQHLAAKTSLKVERRFYLSGTYICQQAIVSGRIDLYVEYTGTALTAILKQPPAQDPHAVFERVRRDYDSEFHLLVEPPLGFNNTFAMVIRGDDARRLNLRTISGAGRFTPQWRAGFGYEFMSRPDGYAGLAEAYNLKFAGPPRILDLGLLYRSLLDHQVDMVAGNSTDGPIVAHDLVALEDDKHYFPPYEAVPVVREATLAEHPEVGRALEMLAGKISDEEMRRMNYAVEGEHKDPATVVLQFLHSKGLD